jgi:hypothetical protein
MRVLVSQRGGCASMETHKIKIATTEQLIRKYDINLCAFMELNYNWMKVNSSANLASCFHEEEQELRSVMAHNTTEFDDTFGKHQWGVQECYASTNSSSMHGNHLLIQEV